jgi:molybdenum cofactor cytidylyltransferase
LATGPDLSVLLDIDRGDTVSIVGAGGKTTTMYRLCDELRARGLRAVSSTTTAIQRPTPRQSPALLVQADTPDLLAATTHALNAWGHATVVRAARRADKYEGVDGPTVALLAGVADVVVVEADGARHLAIKAPAAHEPVVPSGTTVSLSVAGLHALGRPLHDVCHRPEIAARLVCQLEDAPVTPRTLALLLGSPEGGLKGRPREARAWALLTHLTPANRDLARTIAAELGDQHRYTGVLALSHTEIVRLP